MTVESLVKLFRLTRLDWSKLTTWLLGDSRGGLLFLGSLVYFGLYWRIGFFITDNWTIANTLVALADGQLHVQETVYGPPAVETPGYHVVDGQIYGRNYGQLFLALPFVYVVEILSGIVDLSVLVAGIWSILLLNFIARLGSELERQRLFAAIGSALALGTFGINVANGISIAPRWYTLIGLQMSTIMAGAFIGVMLYRLLSAIHDDRTGTFVGAVTVLATPIGFWSSIPKRHILTSLIAIIIIYSFYVSRSPESERTALWARCIAYASVGFWAWIHAPEALVMFIVLVPFDLATARWIGWRRMGVIAGTFLISLVPFSLTNFLISGNPFRPPRSLSGNTLTSERIPASGDGPSGGGLFHELLSDLSAILSPVTALLDLYASSIGVLVTEPHRLMATFVRSTPEITRATAADLSILESTPIFGVFILTPILLYRHWGANGIRFPELASATRKTDAFAITFVVAITLLYMSKLPLHAMWTVRYLLPVVPVGMYFVGRIPQIRDIITEELPSFSYTYSSLVLIGGQFLVVYIISLNLTPGEAMQFHALLGLVAAGIVTLWAALTTFELNDDLRIGAVCIAFPVATGTLFVLLTGIEYYAAGQFGLAMTQLVSEAIPIF